MRTREFERALAWSIQNQNRDALADYYFRICMTIGTLIAEPETPYQIKLGAHFSAESKLYEVRDLLAYQIIQKIKGQKL